MWRDRLFTIMRLFTTILLIIIVAFWVLMVNLFGVPVLTDASNWIQHYWYKEDSVIQDYVDYAWKISWWDLDFVSTLEAENGQWNPHRQSQVPNNVPWMNQNWKEDSRWFCMIHRRWHSRIVDDPNFWSDPYRQLDRCYEMYKWWTKFYWYNVRNAVKNRFEVEYQWGFVAWDKYKEAVETQKKLDETRIKTKQLIAQEVKLEEEARVKWKDCIDSWMCEE